MNTFRFLMNYAITVLSLGILVMIPPAVIGGVFPSTTTINTLSVVLYIQLWTLAIELAYRSAANIYNYRRKELFPGYCYYNFISKTNSKFRPTSGLALIIICLASYAITIYGFGIGYYFVSQIDSLSFSPEGSLSFLDSVYFSVVTATTVGYGDIHPVSGVAKMLVISQIGLSLIYVVFFFSSLAAYQREPKDRA